MAYIALENPQFFKAMYILLTESCAVTIHKLFLKSWDLECRGRNFYEKNPGICMDQ